VRYQRIEGAEFEIGATLLQTFARLLEQVHGGRPERKKPAIGFSMPSSPVNDPRPRLKQIRHAVNRIKDDQLVFVVRKILAGIGALRAVVLAGMHS
jgi:hypothetical protein